MSLPQALLEHFDHPRHAGEFPGDEPGVLYGEAGSSAQGAVVRIQLKVDAGGRIDDVRFRAWGCAATIACASFIAGWLPGRSVEEAYNADIRRLVEAIEVPVERMYAPLIIEDALRAALQEVEPCQSA